MIARPQAELLNMLPVTQVSPLAAKALEIGVSPRFDAALLEAAKTMRDSAPQAPELTLVPRVQRAFESALSELSQKPLDQLKTLAEKPQASRPEIAAIVARTAQTAGLNAEETAVLNDLVPLALPRVLEYKALIQVPGTSAENVKIGGVQPGPQGGTPVREASPADFESDLQAGTRPAVPEPKSLPAPDAADPTTASPLAALNQALAVPVLVSTRTDDGSGRNSALTAGRTEAPVPPQPWAAAAPVQPQAQGRVIQVTTASQPVPGFQPAQAAGPQPLAPGVSASPVATGILPAAAAPPSATQPQSAPGSATPQAKLGPTPQGAVPAGPRPFTASSQTAQPGAAASQPPPAKPFVDFQFQDTAKPVAIVPGSELTLQEDGTWVSPAPLQAKAPVSVTPQSAPLPTPVTEAAQAVPKQSAPIQAPAGSAQVPDLPAQLPSAPANTAPVQPPSAQPQAPSSPVQAAVTQPSGNPTPVAAASGAATAPQGTQTVAVPQAAPQEIQAVALPQAAPQGTQTVAVPQAAPSPQAQALPAPVQPIRTEPGQAKPAAGTDGRAETTEASQAPAASDAVQARRTAGDSAFGSLAQFGQDPMKAMAQQTARDYAVRESVFRQVTEALREAPGTDNGRMHIRLKPAELGEVTVDLVMANGKLSARLVTSQVEVRDAFVRDLHAFKAGLESQGVAVRDISVAVRAGVADQQPQPQQQQQQAAPGWWRELPLEERTPILAAPASYGAGNGSADQRFSALA